MNKRELGDTDVTDDSLTALYSDDKLYFCLADFMAGSLTYYEAILELSFRVQ